MVSFRLCYHWRSIPRAFRISVFYCDYIGCASLFHSRKVNVLKLSPRTSIRPRISMVCPYRTSGFTPAEIRRRSWGFPNNHMWRMDICHIYRRSWMARYFYDLLPCGDTSLDSWLPCPQPPESKSCEIQEDTSRLFLWYIDTFDIFLYPT